MRNRHWSDIIIDDIIGAFKIFIISVLLIYFSIAIINSLPNIDFPIKTDSAWLVSLIMGLFFVFVNFVKNKNKYNV